ncbi:serine C-palmitoyltransferase [Artemisia annua]|uniref:Serine C-palmitoyltransferase n=1 Tax=Artemisia annua TaxID=35608 RepID=A0A2U1L376_ARTAN|nr:serine C-palmitoyltransferase [Artemisia annua]
MRMLNQKVVIQNQATPLDLSKITEMRLVPSDPTKSPTYLENVLRENIADGQPRTHRPKKKIIVVVEGIYNIEGELCKLPEIWHA